MAFLLARNLPNSVDEYQTIGHVHENDGDRENDKETTKTTHKATNKELSAGLAESTEATEMTKATQECGVQTTGSPKQQA